MSVKIVEKGWDALLRVRDAVRLCGEPVRACYVRLERADGVESVSLDTPFKPSTSSGPVVAVLIDPAPPMPSPSHADAVFAIDGLIRVRTIRSGGLPRPLLQLFKTYLPYVFSSMRGRGLGRAFEQRRARGHGRGR